MTRLKSELRGELVGRILGFLRSSPPPPHRIREAVLSRDLGVSRTPVRAALQHLVRQGVLKAHPQGGYVPGRTPPTAQAAAASPHATISLYARILRDIILNDIPEAASGKYLERRYEAGRGELLQVLRRLVREGLAEPSPGRGWSILRFDADQMSRSYHLRTILDRLFSSTSTSSCQPRFSPASRASSNTPLRR